MPKLTVDGIEVEVEDGATVLQACEEAGIGPSNGNDFGSPGFLRINCGCPPELLNEGLKRLHNAFHGIETFRSPER